MKRDMNEIVDKMRGKIPEAYQLRYDECNELVDKSREHSPDATTRAILTAFRYGFALAQRYEANRRKRVEK